MPGAEAGALTGAMRRVGGALLRVPWPLALLLVGAWGALIWGLSSHSVPLRSTPSLLRELLSNLAHAPLFGILTLFVAALILREPGGGWPRTGAARYGAVALFVGGYGVLDEWHQSRVPGRDASALDVLTDVVSALMVLWIVRSLGRQESGDRQLVARLGLGILLCVGCALLAMLP